jgi:hypothetical protein
MIVCISHCLKYQPSANDLHEKEEEEKMNNKLSNLVWCKNKLLIFLQASCENHRSRKLHSHHECFKTNDRFKNIKV